MACLDIWGTINAQCQDLTLKLKKGELCMKISYGFGKIKWAAGVMRSPARTEYIDGWCICISPEEEGGITLLCAPEDSIVIFSGMELSKSRKNGCWIRVNYFLFSFRNNWWKYFWSSFPKRTRMYSSQYTKSNILTNYHIHYYANGKDNRAKGRNVAGIYAKKQRFPIKSRSVNWFIPLNSKGHNIKWDW